MPLPGDIVRHCDELLRSSAFADVAVNGLQVAGTAEIHRLAVAVSTSRYTLQSAAAWGANALLVHHGLLWGPRSGAIAGPFADRLRLLFQHDISLIAYHLPLHGHPEIGNCALFARAAGFDAVGRFATIGGEPLGVVGEVGEAISLAELLNRMREITGREPVAVGAVDENDGIDRVGFLTGSGYSAIEDAVVAGCQVLVTGDVRESTMAEARELGLIVIAAGHEATERLGVQALATELERELGIETHFIPDPKSGLMTGEVERFSLAGREPAILAHDALTGVSLRTITRANFRPVMRLKVSELQQHFVADNWASVAEVYVEESFQPFAIYHAHEPVGFTMYGYEDGPGHWWIIRLMLDERHQAKGYGRAAMLLLIDLMRSRHGMAEIYNQPRSRQRGCGTSYGQLGFEDTGQVDEGEVLLRLKIAADKA